MKELKRQLKRNNNKIKRANKKIAYYVGVKTFFIEENKRINAIIKVFEK